MFPAMYPYYTRALEVYQFEKADGVGKAYDLVIQGFVRFTFLALFPMIFAVTAIYLLVSYSSSFIPHSVSARHAASTKGVKTSCH